MIAAISAYRGTGCAAAGAQPPRHHAVGEARLGKMMAIDVDADAGALVVMLLGDPAQVPLGSGCDLLVGNSNWLSYAVTTNNGYCRFPGLLVPTTLTLRGMVVASQVGALVPGGPAFGFAVSSALDLRIGD